MTDETDETFEMELELGMNYLLRNLPVGAVVRFADTPNLRRMVLGQVPDDPLERIQLSLGIASGDTPATLLALPEDGFEPPELTWEEQAAADVVDNNNNNDTVDLYICRERLEMARSLIPSSRRRLGVHNAAYPDIEKAEEALLDALSKLNKQLEVS